jgi:hypothetical protein
MTHRSAPVVELALLVICVLCCIYFVIPEREAEYRDCALCGRPIHRDEEHRH